VASLPPLLRLPAEIRQMILTPLLVVDDLLHCPSRVYGNRIIGWKGIYAVQADMMFTCRLLYNEVLHVFLEKNNFFFSAPPTKTLFPCAKYARWAKSITFQVHNAYRQEWQTYLSENNSLIVKNLKLQFVTYLSASRDHDSLIRNLISLCEFFIENIVVTEKANVHFSYLSNTDIRRRCSSYISSVNQALISWVDLQECVQNAMIPGAQDKGPLLALKTRLEARDSLT